VSLDILYACHFPVKPVQKLMSFFAAVAPSRSTVYLLIARGDFPAQVRIGPRAPGSVKVEIDGWLQARIAAARSSSLPTKG
jgi:prophage regulatory protein